MSKKVEIPQNKLFSSVRAKLEFIQKSCKEPVLFEDLRQLFIKKGFKNVFIEHGNKEFGKDLVFCINDAVFAEERWYAVIVKNKNATQNDFVTGGEILQQIELSTKFKYKDSKGNEHIIAGVFIIINGSVSFNAKEILQTFIAPVLLPQIKIWDYQSLAVEIETHIKDIFLDTIEPAIHLFSKSQIQNLSDLRTTNQLFDLKLEDIEDIFVNVQTTYSRSMRRVKEYVSFDSSTKQRKIDEDIDGTNEILESSNNFIFHGIPTCGKSLFLRRIGIKALKTKTSGKPNAVFFFEFAKILKLILTDKINIESLIARQYSELTSGEQFNVSDFEKIIILFDSIDEIKSNPDKISLLKLIDLSSKIAPENFQFIVAVRSTEIIDNEQLLLDFEKSELLPFNMGQALRLVKKIIPNNKSKSNTFVDALSNSVLSSGLLRTPLALTLMAILYRDDKIDLKELPANITELYNKFVDTYLDRWDITKGISRQYQYEQTKNVLAFIGLYFNINGITSISIKDLENLLIDIKKEYGFEELNDLNDFIEHLKSKTGIFNFDTNSQLFSFYNHYFQEYFVSISIDDANEKILNQNFFSDWWENAIIFYCGKQPKRDVFLLNASKNIAPLGEKDKLMYLQLLSKCLQASHSIAIKSRLTIIKKLIYEFNEFYLAIIEEGKSGNQHFANMPTIKVIIDLREFFEKLFTSKHISTKDCIEYFEATLIEGEETLSEVTRYCIAYFISINSDSPAALEIFSSHKDINVIWNRILYVDINFLKFKKKTKANTFARIKKKMRKNKFSIIQQLNGKNILYLESKEI